MNDRDPETTQGRGEGLAVLIHHAVALAVLIVLLVVAAVRNPVTMNPDAVSYLRIAGYWAKGNPDLAINGYWGPLISWLMAPLLLWLGDPIQAARIVMAVGAVVYFVGALRLLSAMGLSGVTVATAAWPIALSSCGWSVAFISPDLMVSGLLLFGMSHCLGRDSRAMGVRPMAAGLVYGLAYLAKGVALPVSIVLAVLLPALCLAAGLKTRRSALREAGLTAAGILVLAGPWVLALSLHYGRPTFATTGPIAHALVGPTDVPRYHPTFLTYHTPEAARVTTWEDPTKAPYKFWSPLASSSNFAHQLKLVYWNADGILHNLKALDWSGLGLGAAFLAAVLGMRRLGTSWGQCWWMSLPIMAALTGVYLPVYAADSRYYLACLVPLLGAALGLTAFLSTGSHARDRKTRWLGQGALMLVLVSFLQPALSKAKPAIVGRVDAPFTAAQEMANVVRTRGWSVKGVASIEDERTGFYLAYLVERPYHGHGQGTVDVGEILATGADFVVVGGRATMIPLLNADSRFERVASIDTPTAKRHDHMVLYRFRTGDRDIGKPIGRPAASPDTGPRTPTPRE